jgi:type II secretory pathway component GspD/PulD (secretin)
MDIMQQIDSVSGTVVIANVGEVPITSSKTANAKVAVRDRDTIILGGLIENSRSSSASGVPFLKDVPLLGHLFRSSTKTENRNELIVLIRPTVLPTPEIAALTATAEKDRMPGVKRAEQEVKEAEELRLKQEEKRSRRKSGMQ